MGRLLVPATTTNVDINTSSAENTLISWAIPPNTLQSNGVIHFYIPFDYLNSTAGADTLTLRAKFGATTMFGDISPAIPVGAARRAGVMDLYLFGDGATNAQLLSGRYHLSALSNAAAGTGDFGAIDILPARTVLGAAAIDSTVSQNFVVTAQHTTSNANISVRLLAAFAEVLAF